MKKIIVSLFIFCSLLASGCGSGEATISGTVALDGTPITDGYVTFTPGLNTNGPVVAGRITNGNYTIPAKDGQVSGAYSVTVTASAPTGKKVKSPMNGAESDEFVSIIPDKYTGTTSVLTADIVKGKNTVDLKLESENK